VGSELLTRVQVERALPPNLRNSATQEFTDHINSIIADPLVAEAVRENFIGYANVLKDGKFKTQDYLNAVIYVSYKLMGDSNQDAYAKTFPKRYQDLVAKGTSTKDISAYVASYNKGKLVNLVLEQCLVPAWVLNQDLYQKAINRQAWLMENAISEKVQTEAANSLLTHLKRPETTKVELDVGIKDNSGLSQLTDTLAVMAERQLELMRQGVGVKEITATPLIQGEVVRDSDPS
jgi:hypothetical protein